MVVFPLIVIFVWPSRLYLILVIPCFPGPMSVISKISGMSFGSGAVVLV